MKPIHAVEISLVAETYFEFISEGRVCKLDLIDEPLILGYKCKPTQMTNNLNWYLRCGAGTLHRRIIEAPLGLTVDHINGDGLDNRRSNLRIVTSRQNSQNRAKHDKSALSAYKGVTKETHASGRVRYRARLRLNGKLICLGRFAVELDAAKAYNEAAAKYFGEYARLNEVAV